METKFDKILSWTATCHVGNGDGDSNEEEKEKEEEGMKSCHVQPQEKKQNQRQDAWSVSSNGCQVNAGEREREWNWATSHYKKVPFRNSNHRERKKKKMIKRLTSKECEIEWKYHTRDCIGIGRFRDSNFFDN